MKKLLPPYSMSVDEKEMSQQENDLFSDPGRFQEMDNANQKLAASPEPLYVYECFN